MNIDWKDGCGSRIQGQSCTDGVRGERSKHIVVCLEENTQKILNKHMGRCLSEVEALCPRIPQEAKVVIKNELEWLAEDVVKEVSGNLKED